MNLIKTERLILRPYKSEDLNDFYEYVSDPEVVKYEPYQVMTREEAKGTLDYRITSDEFIAVELISEKKLIGNLYLGVREFDTMELGYVFNKKYGGKGYATEGCLAVISHAFNNGTHRIYSECDPDNVPSWRLLERLNFIREGYLKQNVYFWKNEAGKPLWKDTYIYSLLSK